MPDLTLIADAGFISPWAFHAFVALEEKQLAYTLDLVPLPIPDDRKALMFQRCPMAKIPMLVHGDLAFTESLAISEYLAEQFPTPTHPRLFPADLGHRARARMVMNVLRTSLFKLREARPSTTMFGTPSTTPLAGPAADEAAELVRMAAAVLTEDRASIAPAWCIADADLSFALMRLVANHDPVPPHLERYARTHWDRPSTQKFLAARPRS